MNHLIFETPFWTVIALLSAGVGKYQFTRFIVIAGSGFTQSAAMTLPTIIMVALACKFDVRYIYILAFLSFITL